MPVNKKKMSNMKKSYGSKKGSEIYYAMEQQEKAKAEHKKNKEQKQKARKINTPKGTKRTRG